MARLRIGFKAVHVPGVNYPVDVFNRIDVAFTQALTGPIQAILVGAMILRTLGWQHSPSFLSKFNTNTRSGGLTGYSILVRPEGANARYWGYVSLGVHGRTIVPRRARMLFIRGGVGGYAPRTTTGGGYAGPGAYASGGFFARSVEWPGIKPRGFEKDIVDKHESEIIGILQAAWSAAIT